ncbi:hypothetical protein [Lentibacillus sp. CBA3610]|nr:hypothetical protein [Lentibacillus sp. CBA3610]
MKVKILDAMTSGGLEKKINRFIEEEYVTIIDIQIAAGFGSVVAMIQYEE